MNAVQKSKGFTLIEVIFVLVILAILACVLVAVYPKLLQNMRVKADLASAKGIANAIRDGYIDNSTDEQVRDSFRTFIESSDITNRTIKLSNLTMMEDFLDINIKPNSLLNVDKIPYENQYFFVGFIRRNYDYRIVISIGTDEGIDISGIDPYINSDAVMSYDGYSPDIVYIEPRIEG